MKRSSQHPPESDGLPPVWYSKAERFVCINFPLLITILFFIICILFILFYQEPPDFPDFLASSFKLLYLSRTLCLPSLPNVVIAFLA